MNAVGPGVEVTTAPCGGKVWTFYVLSTVIVKRPPLSPGIRTLWHPTCSESYQGKVLPTHRALAVYL